MATLYIEEYANLADVTSSDAQIPGAQLAGENVTVGSSSARSTTDFDASTKFLIITSDVNCQFEVGDGSVTADADSRILWANTYREIEVKSSDLRIAVIDQQ